MIGEEDVEDAARLARLRLGPDEVRRYQGQLGRILEYMAQLEELDTGSVPPTAHVLGLRNVLRGDEPRPCADRESLLANAPAREGDYFKVPKVITAAVLALASAVPAAPVTHARGRARPSQQATLTMRRGIDAYMQARFDDGVDILSEALAQHPGWKTASGFRAICLWTTGDVEGARADAELALNLRPNSAESFAARGFARFVVRDMDLASSDFITSARMNSRYAPAYFGMGSVMSSEERLQEALSNLNIAVKLDPKATVARIVRGTVREKLRDYRRAITDYTRVLKAAPAFSWAYFYRGRSHREVKDYKQAISDFTKFLEHNPDYEQALYFRSNAYFLTGEYQSAARDLSRVIALNPKNGLAYANRGVALAELGDRDGALSDLRRAKQLSPEKASKIQAQIERMQAAKPKRKQAGKPKVTGTPGKGLGEEPELSGIAAEPDLPGEVPLDPLPPEEALPESKRPPYRDPGAHPQGGGHGGPAGLPPARLPIDIESEESGDEFLFLR